jgi:hypothetical protein
VGFKRCSVCKQAWYCGAACQNANWKRHKKTCAPPLPLQDVAEKVFDAHAADDWRGVLKFEGRMEELLAQSWSDDACEAILGIFAMANKLANDSTGSKDHARSCVGLDERRVPLLGKLQRFQYQGEAMCDIGGMLRVIDSTDAKASIWFQRARDVGAAHGFFTLESKACMGLGTAALREGRHEEGLALLRNSLVAAELSELDELHSQLEALHALIEALFSKPAIEEVEPLVAQYREVAKAQSERSLGVPCFAELDCHICSARLHEVLCISTPRGEPPYSVRPLHFLKLIGVWHRFHRAQEKTRCSILASC